MQYYVNSRNELEQEINILKKLGIQNIVAWLKYLDIHFPKHDNFE
jgi:hypothetical protein